MSETSNVEDPLEGLSITSPPQQSKPKGHPRPNFPLPAELRNRIYEYLLDGEHVEAAPFAQRAGNIDGNSSAERVARRHSLAHTYAFSTNILAVNQEIYREASGVFYSNNSFVLVHLDWRSLDLLKHCYNLPIVTERGQALTACKKVRLEVTFVSPEFSSESPGVPSTPVHTTSFIMLCRDLPILRDIIQWFSYTVAHNATVINLNSSGTAVSAAVPEDFVRPIKTKLSFYLRGLCRAKTRALVEPFWALRLPGQEIETSGLASGSSGSPGTPTTIEYQRRAKMEQVVFAKPMLWRMHRYLSCRKRDADDLARKGRHASAFLHYHLTIRACAEWPIFCDAQWRSVMLQGPAEIPARLIMQLLFDISVTASILGVKMSRQDETTCKLCFAWMRECWHMIFSEGYMPQLFPGGRSTLLRAHDAPKAAMLLVLLGTTEPSSLGDVVDFFETYVRVRPNDQGLVHDLDFVKRLRDDPTTQEIFGAGDRTKLICQNLSIYKEPLRISETPLNDAFIDSVRPGRTQGWLDVEMMLTVAEEGTELGARVKSWAEENNLIELARQGRLQSKEPR